MKNKLVGLLIASLALAACKDTGRIKADTEGDLVGATGAGSAAYNQIVEEGVQKLLGSHSAQVEGTERMTLAVLGVDNQSSEELGDWGGQIYEELASSINNSGRYRTVSRRMVDRALQLSNARQDDLFIPAKRRDFLATLEAEDNPVQLLLFPKITSGTTQSGRTKQVDYVLTLELVDVLTGWDERFSSKVRKEYKKGR